MFIHESTLLWVIKSGEFIWLHILLDYTISFKISEKAVSAPLRSIIRRLPSVMCILIVLILFLFIGLKVTLLGSMVKLYDGLNTLVLKL